MPEILEESVHGQQNAASFCWFLHSPIGGPGDSAASPLHGIEVLDRSPEVLPE
jgi:hypothetical protein